ncbi:MAG: pitrilysin family protein [Vicingaceae bacterium]
MIKYHEFNLKNGLHVIVHQDKSTPIVAFNLLYNVGAKHELESRTGFAHLFEHLMFGGSENIPSFDGPLQEVGGENNAFTSNDLTNYYITLPKESLETAFWLESDRMKSLAFTPKSLEVQRQVVIEEFKQRYLNQPYGDIYLLLRPLAYLKHPYKWATIGKEVAHIEQANMEEVKAFFFKHYRPNNAILSIAGDVSIDEIKQLCDKWFSDIPAGEKVKPEWPAEENQIQARSLVVERDVPQNAIYKAYHMVDRLHPDYYATDMITDILSQGNSSRFYQELIKNQKLFSEVDAYITGDIEAGLLIVAGKLNPTVTMEQAEAAIDSELEKLVNDLVSKEELQKVKNKVTASNEFGKTNVLNKAMGLAISALIESPDLINTELDGYLKVTAEDIKRVAKTIFQKNNCSTLYYKSKNTST